MISLYNFWKHRECGGCSSWCCSCWSNRRTAVHPVAHAGDTSSGDSGLFELDEDGPEEELYEHQGTTTPFSPEDLHKMDPFARLALKKQRSEATDHSKSTTGSGTVAAVMSTVVGATAGTVSRGISGGSSSNADYEPFFAIAGEDEVDEDEEDDERHGHSSVFS